MRQIVIAMLLLAALARGELSLLPYPNHVESGSETLTLSRCQLVLEPDGSLDRSFIDILSVHHDLIFAKEHCEPKFPVRVVQLGAGSKASSAECKSEYYELAVTMESIKISAECPVGVIRGVATLWQLMRLQEEDAHAPLTADWTSNQAESKRATKVRIEQVPIHIKDSPRFEYRGLMIDSSRHFLSIATIKRVIVSMMLAKMSALHWHFVDDDSFTMQSKHIPGLAESASFHNTQFYTAEQIKDIVQFAKDRGVRIIPEIDCPGHSRAVGLYPPLKPVVTCFDSVWPHNLQNFYKIHGGPATSALDPTMDLTYSYAENVLKDLLDYFGDELIHLGGDEVKSRCWAERQSIKQFMEKHNIPDYPHLMNYFIEKMRGILRRLDKSKRTVYWSNPATFDITYGEGDVLQYWGTTKNLPDLTRLYPKNKLILSPCDILYLDCSMGNKYGGRMWCGDYKTWLKMYKFEPTNYSLPEKNILGAEACMWGEIATDFNLDLRLWPRLAAMAETLWMTKRTGEINLTSLVQRLTDFSAKLNEMGVASNPVGKQYCELNPKECFDKY